MELQDVFKSLERERTGVFNTALDESSDSGFAGTTLGECELRDLIPSTSDRLFNTLGECELFDRFPTLVSDRGDALGLLRVLPRVS